MGRRPRPADGADELWQTIADPAHALLLARLILAAETGQEAPTE